MLILALEGAGARCSAALLRHGAVLTSALHEGPRGHPTALPPMAEQVLAEARVKPTALDAIAVGVGPGGFTGLRTSLALAEGLALALGKPLIGVTTGEALVMQVSKAQRASHIAWSVLDHRQGRVVLEVFPAGALQPEAPRIFSLETLPEPGGALILVGDLALSVGATLAARGSAAAFVAPEMPTAAAVGQVAHQRLVGALPWRGSAPLYAEPPAITLPR